MPNLTTPDDVVDYMGAATSRADWVRRRANVQMANENRDPSFWTEMITEPDLYSKTVGAQSQTGSKS